MSDEGSDSMPTNSAQLSRESVVTWRKQERERLIAGRMALSVEDRTAAAASITRRLADSVGDLRGKHVSLYWPFRGEPDLRPWVEEIWQQGGVALLPIVIEKGRPLVFKTWRQGEPLARGVWNIPIPAEGIEAVPDVVIAPVVGYDPANYRLGYGGGFFDRTLAALDKKPLAIGIGYASQAIPTIHPQSHDIPMDQVIVGD